MTVYFTKAFSELWLAQLSYTYTSLRGNLNGLYRHDTSQLDPNISSDFDLRSLLINRIGPLPGDGSQIKLHLAKQFLITGSQSLVIGGNFTTRQGDPITYAGLHPLYGPGEIYLLPRGSAGRTPWISSVDLRLAYSFNFDKDRALTVSLDIFNLLNFQSATRVDQNYTFSAINPILTGAPQIWRVPGPFQTRISNIRPPSNRPETFASARDSRFERAVEWKGLRPHESQRVGLGRASDLSGRTGMRQRTDSGLRHRRGGWIAKYTLVPGQSVSGACVTDFAPPYSASAVNPVTGGKGHRQGEALGIEKYGFNIPNPKVGIYTNTFAELLPTDSRIRQVCRCHLRWR